MRLPTGLAELLLAVFVQQTLCSFLDTSNYITGLIGKELTMYTSAFPNDRIVYYPQTQTIKILNKAAIKTQSFLLSMGVRLGGFGSRFMLIIGVTPDGKPLLLCMNTAQKVLPCDTRQGPPLNVQYWNIRKKPGGFQINAEGTNLCLQHASDEGDIRGWECNNSLEQRFDFFDLEEDEVYKSAFGGPLGGIPGVGELGNLVGKFGSALGGLRAKASSLGKQLGSSGMLGGLANWGNKMRSQVNAGGLSKALFGKGREGAGFGSSGFDGQGMSSGSGRPGGFKGSGGWGLNFKRPGMAGSARNFGAGDFQGFYGIGGKRGYGESGKPGGYSGTEGFGAHGEAPGQHSQEHGSKTESEIWRPGQMFNRFKHSFNDEESSSQNKPDVSGQGFFKNYQNKFAHMLKSVGNRIKKHGKKNMKSEASGDHTDEGGYREPGDDDETWNMPSLGGRYKRMLANKRWLKKRDLVQDKTALFDSLKEDYGMPWRRGRFRTLSAYSHSR
jgi:hypothetical protein